jgi:hypothetical protein
MLQARASSAFLPNLNCVFASLAKTLPPSGLSKKIILIDGSETGKKFSNCNAYVVFYMVRL